MNTLLPEIRARWVTMFATLADGDDVPPAARLRTEGLMEAAVLVGEATARELDDAMAQCYREAFDSTIAGEFGNDWRDFFPFPQIPAMGRRAPVYPSTPE